MVPPFAVRGNMPPLRRVRDITSSSVGSAIWFSTSIVSRVHRQVLARGESSRVWLGVTPGILTKGTEITKEDDGIPGRGSNSGGVKERAK
ncbi:hypothetical protein B296_00025946 [Ensete ventricosum]|uniref:Uncharacterized protein n=1 Tax=Ensete ventricosum TaxID=4639 RepID=A0A426YQH8_ENSVE|nr:hypothetical protein B296_00025946 [Ensete ventricosum]